jgi:hypothetical protein
LSSTGSVCSTLHKTAHRAENAPKSQLQNARNHLEPPHSPQPLKFAVQKTAHKPRTSAWKELYIQEVIVQRPQIIGDDAMNEGTKKAKNSCLIKNGGLWELPAAGNAAKKLPERKAN